MHECHIGPTPTNAHNAHINNKSVKQYHTKNIITDICIHVYPHHADAYSATQMCTWSNISFLLRKSTKTQKQRGKTGSEGSGGTCLYSIYGKEIQKHIKDKPDKKVEKPKNPRKY